jgi:hypothetical protein
MKAIFTILLLTIATISFGQTYESTHRANFIYMHETESWKLLGRSDEHFTFAIKDSTFTVTTAGKDVPYKLYNKKFDASTNCWNFNIDDDEGTQCSVEVNLKSMNLCLQQSNILDVFTIK